MKRLIFILLFCGGCLSSYSQSEYLSYISNDQLLKYVGLPELYVSYVVEHKYAGYDLRTDHREDLTEIQVDIDPEIRLYYDLAGGVCTNYDIRYPIRYYVEVINFLGKNYSRSYEENDRIGFAIYGSKDDYYMDILKFNDYFLVGISRCSWYKVE